MTACSGSEVLDVEPVPAVTVAATADAQDPLAALGLELCSAIRAQDVPAFGVGEAVEAIQAATGTSDLTVVGALIDVHCPEYG